LSADILAISALEFNQVNQVFQKMADGISGRNCPHFARAAPWPAAGLTPETPCETSPERNSEPQNIEYRTAEFRRVVSLRSVFFIKTIEYLPSIFDIHYSIFVFWNFFYRSNWPFRGRWLGWHLKP